MFKSRKPKIINSEAEEEEDHEITVIKPKKTLFGKKPLVNKSKTSQSDTNDRTSQPIKARSRIRLGFEESKDEIDDADFESIVIKPKSRKNDFTFNKSVKNSKTATFSVSSETKKQPPNVTKLENDLKFQSDGTENDTSKPSYTIDYLKELKAATPTRSIPKSSYENEKPNSTQSFGVTIIDDDIEMNDLNGDVLQDATAKKNKTGKQVRFNTEVESSNGTIASLSTSLPDTDTHMDDLFKDNPKRIIIDDEYGDDSIESKLAAQDSDSEDSMIIMDPASMREEKEIQESRIYNEYDMEEGVEYLDEDLAIGNQEKLTQDKLKKLQMEKAIEEMEDEEQEGDSETFLWERNQLKSSNLRGVTNEGIENHSALDMRNKPPYNFVDDGKDELTESIEESNSKSGENIVSPFSNLPSIPTFEHTLNRVQKALEALQEDKNKTQDNISHFKSELDSLNQRQLTLQEQLDNSSLQFSSVLKNRLS